MIIHIEGIKGGKLSKVKTLAVSSAAKAFAKQLSISKLHSVVIITPVDHVVVPGKLAASCWALTNRLFKIQIAMYGDWLLNLAHEMVHVKQFSLDELSTDLAYWKATKILKKTKYKDLPHEKEAFALQRQLVTGYCCE